MNLVKLALYLSMIPMLLLPMTLEVASGSSGNPTATIRTNKGTIVVELYENDAPVTVNNFIRYAQDGFFDGLIFHRVIEGFMIQGGGFRPGVEYVDPTYNAITNEASTSMNRNLRGTIAMARTNDPHSATSQFFINHADNDFLDWDRAADGWGYCVFGRVIQGMNVVDSIAVVPTHSTGGHDDVPVQDVIIQEVTIEQPGNGGDPGEPENGEKTSENDDSQPFYRNLLFMQIVISVIVATGIILALRYKEKKD